MLSDGHEYSGYGYYNDNNEFIPQGYGKKFFKGMHATGNFVEGIINGPAIISHDFYMYTMQMKGNRGNGWGLSINNGELVEFGYYRDSKIVVNLTSSVMWYYKKMYHSNRRGENMLNIYSSKEDHSLSKLLIGYPIKKMMSGMTLVSMGFHFMKDGTVWVGNSEKFSATGNLIKFCSDGHVLIGRFHEGELVEEFGIQKLIDCYYGSNKEDNLCSGIIPFSNTFRGRERAKYNSVKLDTSRNYFEM